MIKVTYEIDGQSRDLPIPTDASDILFSSWCDFKSSEAIFLTPPTKEEDTSNDQYGLRKAKELLDMLATIYGPNVSDVPETVPGDDGALLLENGFVFAIGSELSAIRLYAHLVTTVQSYVPAMIPKTFKLKHGGQKFFLKLEKTGRILADRPLSMGEGIEVMEYQRRAGEAFKSAMPKDIGNIEFTLGLTEFAILVRKQGEQLPANPGERDKFIATRRELFSSLKMDSVLSLRFFFLNALQHCRANPRTGFSLWVRLNQRSGVVRKLIKRVKK
jgi:hypothetical protein